MPDGNDRPKVARGIMRQPSKRSKSIVLAVLASLLAGFIFSGSLRNAGAQSKSEDSQAKRKKPSKEEWSAYAGSNASAKYSALDQINKDNIKNLRIVWRQSATPEEARRGARVPIPLNYSTAPLMIGGVLYMSTGYGTVAALDPATGKFLWTDVPPETLAAESASGQTSGDASSPSSKPEVMPITGRGLTNRGVSYWDDGGDGRIVTVTGKFLVELNAKTGKRYPDFGAGGAVDLTQSYERPATTFRYGGTPLIVRDVIVVGGIAANGPQFLSGDIRGFDARTGKKLWTFHAIPRPGEFGNETWLNDSWSNAGGAGVWSMMSADDELGYVYLPMESAITNDPYSGDYYGGDRPGNNLFDETLVCLDARTGKRIWHFQMIHHGLYDWDLPAAPNLVDIKVGGRNIKAVAQISKQYFTYVFDRVTGKPVWPIEERPVPKGDVPGEWYSPTQPYPTKPPAYDGQDATIDDLVDFTPELRQEAIKIISQYRYGNVFMPPSVIDPSPGGTKGTLNRPGTAASTWNGAGFDPETGILYVPSVHMSCVVGFVKPTNPNTKTPWIVDPNAKAVWGDCIEGPQGLPEPFKPPYGRLTAIDLNKGEILWVAANGDGPRDHPAIKHLNLPPLGQGGRASPLVTKTMVFLGEGGNAGVPAVPKGGGGKMFRAYDKKTGKVLWETELPGGTTGPPVTYMVKGKQFIVVAVGLKDVPGELVALALP